MARKAKKRSAKKGRKAKGTVPLNVLVARRNYLTGIIDRRAKGSLPRPARLSHRTPKQAGRARAKRKGGKKRKK
jgi:hypothetical protein